MIHIAVTSLKGGTGVTALVSGLAQAASAVDLDVVCVDGDPQETLKYHLGLVALTKGESDNRNRDRIALRSPEAGPGHADLILWDIPQARPDWALEALESADAVVLVALASSISVAMVPAIKSFLDAGENRFLLINGEDGRIPLKQTASSYLSKLFADRLIGKVRHDEAVDEAVASLEPLSISAPHSSAWGDMRTALTSLIKRMESQPAAFKETM